MRKTNPDTPRPFRTPWVPYIPIAGVFVCFTMMAFLPLDTWLRLGIWMLLGVVIYYAYGKKHSVIRKSMEGKA
jgi:APA family basic amino acid/polyamine antiporter